MQQFVRVPGLSLHHAAFAGATLDRLLGHTMRLQANISRCMAETAGAGATPVTVPQPVRSSQHNLATERSFVRLRLPYGIQGGQDGQGGAPASTLQCEHFAEYGSRGHALTYFQKNCSIPPFAVREIIEPVLSKLPRVVQVARDAGKCVEQLQWRMTLNCYQPTPPAGRDSGPGLDVFPYHIDIAQNGEVTAIVTLGSPGVIQFAAPSAFLEARAAAAADTDVAATAAAAAAATAASAEAFALADELSPETVELPPGSMLVAADDARWRFVHRVVQATGPQPATAAKLPPRYSLVFGCQ
jgi:hypothetical protein